MGRPLPSQENSLEPDASPGAESDASRVYRSRLISEVPGPPPVPTGLAIPSANDNSRLALQEVRGITARASLPSLPPPLAKVGRYDMLGRIAVGGMAEIFLAREDVETGAQRHAAIKVLKRQGQGGTDDAYFEELFVREGRTASQLVHPNICHVYEFGKWGDDFYIAMEYIDGVSLRGVLKRLAQQNRRLAPELAAGITAQVAAALDYAHNARDSRRRPLAVVHLDVNPQNVMLRHDGIVKLLDFGVAQVAESHAESRTDMVKGKAGYMAPEQALQQPLDRRVDVFALGLCLYEMLTGEILYRRETLLASLSAMLKEPVPSVREKRPEIPAELDQIVQRALAKDPKNRFQTAGELQAALETYLAGAGEVVSNRRIALLMEELYPAAQTSGPKLETGPEVARRLAVKSAVVLRAPRGSGEIEAGVEPLSLEPIALPRTRLWPGMIAGALLLAGIAGAALWWRTESPSAAPPPSVSAVPSNKPSVSEPEPIKPAARAEPAEPSAPEPTPHEQPTSRETSRSARRRASPGFVADPGF